MVHLVKTFYMYVASMNDVVKCVACDGYEMDDHASDFVSPSSEEEIVAAIVLIQLPLPPLSMATISFVKGETS